MSWKSALLLVASGMCLMAGVAGGATIKINFQLRGADIPPGYYPDYGQAYGLQDNGLNYGWSRNIEADARHRNSANAKDQRYDTFVHLQKGADAIWEIELPPGSYKLHIVAGDPDNTDQTNTFDVEGTIITDPTPATGNFDEYDVTVQMSDGRLTIKPAPGSVNSKIMYVDITSDAINLGVLFGKAKNPNPADGAKGVALTLLQWKPGQTAVFHNVYLGTTPELGAADLVGPKTMIPMFYAPGLIPGQTYYWRIDEVEADMVTVRTGDVWSFTTLPLTASSPSPMNASPYVQPDAVELSWLPGASATKHDLYLSTDKSAVETGAASAFIENLLVPLRKLTTPLEKGKVYYWRVDEIDASGKVTAGQVWSFTTIPDVPITDPNMLGWWKLDGGMGTVAFDSSGHANHGTIQGATWIEGILGDALQFNGADSVSLPAGLVQSKLGSVACWVKTTQGTTGTIFYSTATTGNGYGGENELHLNIDTSQARFYIEGGAADVSVWSGVTINSGEWQHVAVVWDATAVKMYINGAEIAKGSNSGNAFTASAMTNLGRPAASERFYIGAIDDVRFYNKALSAEQIVDSMRGDPLLAWGPQPARGATVDIRGATELSWSAGNTAAKHDVYFGKDRTVVGNADTAAPEYKGRQAGTAYSLAGLVEFGGGAYFWRVDEVEADGTTIHKGAVWTFTIPDYLLIDDFEGYRNSSPNRVFQTWIDGFGFSEDEFFPKGNPGNGSGAMVGYDPLAGNIMETTIVHGGRQSMPMGYDNSVQPYYSETERTFASPQDWTASGVNTLSLQVRGYPQPTSVAVTETGGKMSLTGSGADIWGASDQFTYAYKSLSGDGTIVAKVVSNGTGTNRWAKGGVMIRDSLDGRSASAQMVLTGGDGNGGAFQNRASAGLDMGANDAASNVTVTTAIAPPYWVKLERTGDTFNAYTSSDGSTWTMLGTANVVMTAPVYIGLCVTSHAATEQRTFQFESIKTTGSVTGAWQGAEIMSPRYNSVQDLYVAIQDSTNKVAVVKDATAVTSATWVEVKMPLSGFTGVSMTKVKKIFIGVGDRTTPAADGSGLLYIDDVRVIKQ